VLEIVMFYQAIFIENNLRFAFFTANLRAGKAPKFLKKEMNSLKPQELLKKHAPCASG
jgi:hypothetical protein